LTITSAFNPSINFDEVEVAILDMKYTIKNNATKFKKLICNIKKPSIFLLKLPSDYFTNTKKSIQNTSI